LRTSPRASRLAAACTELELGDGGVSHALHLGETGRRRRHRLGEGAEAGDQLLGQRLDVALRDGAEQHQLEQFVVADRVRAGLAKARAQPFAVAVIMRRGLGEAGFIFAGDPLARHAIRPQSWDAV
jgi:hypothetical protein